ncbi:MAG TPA: hypothetical protein VEA44_13950 [Caulobacter sp.]|nr:hypothetical protein [Caulobacter sp.]
MRVAFARLIFDLPEGWQDVSDDLPPEDPATLACSDGAGVIQFSTARYAGGVDHTIAPAALQEVIADVLGTENVTFEVIEPAEDSLAKVVGTVVDDSKLMAVGSFSDGRRIAFVTYSVAPDAAEIEAELAEFRALLMSAEFQDTDA